MTLGFGKHKGKNIKDVASEDPHYMFWLYENEIINVPEEVLDISRKELSSLSKSKERWFRDDDWGSPEAEAWSYALPNHS
jgi:uncharacterized protein (DUF3820 family)